MTLRYGQPAPEFSLLATDGKPVTLEDLRKQGDVVLVFYCYDWGSI